MLHVVAKSEIKGLDRPAAVSEHAVVVVVLRGRICIFVLLLMLAARLPSTHSREKPPQPPILQQLPGNSVMLITPAVPVKQCDIRYQEKVVVVYCR